jgi:hypothetical protein
VVRDRLITGIARGYADLDWTALGLIATQEAGLDAAAETQITEKLPCAQRRSQLGFDLIKAWAHSTNDRFTRSGTRRGTRRRAGARTRRTSWV